MIGVIARRLLLMIPTLVGTAVLIFFVLRVVPGDIVEMKLRGEGGQVDREMVERERSRLGLDKPLIAQFGDWVAGLPSLDLGNSMLTGRPVIEEIASRFELTFQIAVLATLIAILIAIPLGSLSALFPGSWFDHVIRIVTVGGLAVPSFWFGMLIILFLLHVFDWLPPLVFTPLYRDPLANLSQLIWPALAVGYRYAAIVTRMIRSSMLEALHEDYVRTARAKGLSQRLVVLRHALPNALLPTLTLTALEFAFLLGGLVVTEQVFNLNGIGQLFARAIEHNDFILIQGLVMVLAFVFIVTNLAVDLATAAIDPRVRRLA